MRSLKKRGIFVLVLISIIFLIYFSDNNQKEVQIPFILDVSATCHVSCECTSGSEFGGSCGSGGCGTMRRDCDGCNWGGWYCSGETPNYGDSCNCGACGCGGTIQCGGSCSGSDPTPGNYGNSCGNCGGTIQCDGSCSVQDPPNYGESCNQGACGSGTIQCDGSCSGGTPPNYGESCGNCGIIDCSGSCSNQGECSAGSAECNSGVYRTCTSSCTWTYNGTDADNDTVDFQCEDAICDNSTGVCDTAVSEKCIAQVEPEDNCADTLDNDCDGDADIKDFDCLVSLGFSECGDGNIDFNETCNICPQDAGCSQGSVCCFNDDPVTCSANCIVPVACDTGYCLPGSICVDGLCACNQVSDGICTLDNTCQGTDPDCCNLKDVYWENSCVYENDLVNLHIELSTACNDVVGSFDLWEEEFGPDDDVTPDPDSTFVIDTFANTTWKAVWIDDGFLQGNPEYYFIGSVLDKQKTSANLEVRPCAREIDFDCDGVLDDNDQCVTNASCADVDNKGCLAGQFSCVSQWDCTEAVWGECDENNVRTRDTDLCNFVGNDEFCNDPSFRALIPTQVSCLLTEEFGFFSNWNILLVIIILFAYYLYITKKKPKKKKKTK